MGDVRRISAVAEFLKSGGTFVVLRPVPDAPGGDRSFISLDARRRMHDVREAAMQKDCVDLVLIPPDNETALVTVRDRRWPQPITVPELALPSDTSRDGEQLNSARGRLGNAPLESYLADRVAGRVLLNWNETMFVAINRVLGLSMARGGRIIVCGGEPFIGFLAGSLVPNEGSLGKSCAGSNMLEVPVCKGEGFVLNLVDGDMAQIRPLFSKPSPVAGSCG